MGYMRNFDESFTGILIDDALVIIFGIDIVVTLNSGYTDPITGFPVTDKKLIFQRYASRGLLIDLASMPPWKQIDSLINYNELEPIKFLRILRLSRIAMLYKFFDSQRLSGVTDTGSISPQLKNISILFLQIFLTGHIICCFWFYITTPSATGFQKYDDQSMDPRIRTWVTEYGYDNVLIINQYIASLYWTFQTLFTIGYGDIHPVNNGEKVFAILTMLAGSILFGMLLAKIKDLLDGRNIQKNEIYTKMEELKEYLEEKNFPTYLRIQTKVKTRNSAFVY